MGVRCVHRRALAVNFFPRLLSFIGALLGVCVGGGGGGGEETGDGVAYHIHTQKTNSKILKYF